MRIISKFKDYYDGVQRQGFDSDLVYVRVKDENSHIIPLQVAHMSPHDWSATTAYKVSTDDVDRKLHCRFVPVVFCGKFYPRFVAWTDNFSLVQQVEFGNTAEAVVAALRKILGAEPNPKPRYTRWIDKTRRRTFIDELQERNWELDHQLAHAPLLSVRLLNEEEKNRSPTVRLMVTKNPCLKESGFQAIVDPYTAYQEISMYLGGVLASTGNPMIQLPDKDLIAKQGFDKWSFRKMPAK